MLTMCLTSQPLELRPVVGQLEEDKDETGRSGNCSMVSFSSRKRCDNEVAVQGQSRRPCGGWWGGRGNKKPSAAWMSGNRALSSHSKLLNKGLKILYLGPNDLKQMFYSAAISHLIRIAGLRGKQYVWNSHRTFWLQCIFRLFTWFLIPETKLLFPTPSPCQLNLSHNHVIHCSSPVVLGSAQQIILNQFFS